MKVLLFFTLLSLTVLAAGPAAVVQAQTRGPGLAPSAATGEGEVNYGSRSGASEGDGASSPISFADRFEKLQGRVTPTTVNTRPAPLPGTANACFPDSQFKAHGFYTLSGGTSKEGDVFFGVFSRLQFYSLTPDKDGDIETPTEWNAISATSTAHSHGSKADLVISNDAWNLDGRPGDDPNGLRLSKSYVLLTLIDDIVDVVEGHNFDGVTVDFRLPDDVTTQDSYAFLINRLNKRLETATRGTGENDLLQVDERLLNIVIDKAFVDALDSVYAEQNPEETGSSNPGLKAMFAKVSQSVDLVFVDKEAEDIVDDALKSYSADRKTLIDVLIVSNEDQRSNPVPENQFNANLISGDRVGIWDVASDGKNWQTSETTGLDSRVFRNRSYLQNQISRLVCTRRGTIADVLSGLTPVLSLLVLVSWVFYDFPPRLNKSISNLVIWGLIAISFVAFIVLLVGLPSLNPKNIQLYVVIAAFVIPLLYVVWTLATRLRPPDYP